MFGFFFLFVAAWATYGIYYMLRANRRSQQYLEGGAAEAPLQLDHLSGQLRRLAEDTRLLRISLEAPIRDVNDLRIGDFHQTAGEDMESFDNMLMNVSRMLADWVRGVETLPEPDLNRLGDLGLTPDAVRSALSFEGGAFERRNLNRAGAPPLDERLRAISRELARFETNLQATQRVYR